MELTRAGSRLAKFTLAAGLLAAMGTIASTQAADLGGSIKDDYAEPQSSPLKRWYVSIQGGGAFTLDDVDFSNGQTTVRTDFDSGFTFGAALGYRWNNLKFGVLVPRTEVEVNYTENEVNSLDFSGNGRGNERLGADSKISSVGVLFNLFFDARNAFGHGITPYFGGGIGFNVVNHDILYGNAINLSDEDTAFAWHVTAGLDFKVTETSSLFVDVGYHQAVDVGSVRRQGIGPAPGGAANNGTFEDDIDSIVVKGGLRVSF